MPRDVNRDDEEPDVREATNLSPDVPVAWQPSERMMSEIAEPQESSEGSDWVTSMRDVAVSDIDDHDSYVESEEDFRKVSKSEMEEGFRRLESEVRPRVEAGEGPDDFSRTDVERNLDHAHGDRRIYDAFYGDDAIRLERNGDHYTVTNGLHRLFVAREQGITSVPARVVERRRR